VLISKLSNECHELLTLLAMQATFYKSKLNGAPIKPMQHPLHYPHGTLFMAPGPAGQTAAIPDDPELKTLMQREYNNYGVIHDAYNFDVKPERKSLMGKATELWKREQRDRMRQRMIEGNIADREMRRCTPARLPRRWPAHCCPLQCGDIVLLAYAVFSVQVQMLCNSSIRLKHLSIRVLQSE
jgi:hypothetical protein